MVTHSTDCRNCGAPVLLGQRAGDMLPPLVLDRHEQTHGAPRYVLTEAGFVRCRDNFEQAAYIEHQCLAPTK